MHAHKIYPFGVLVIGFSIYLVSCIRKAPKVISDWISKDVIRWK